MIFIRRIHFPGRKGQFNFIQRVIDNTESRFLQKYTTEISLYLQAFMS